MKVQKTQTVSHDQGVQRLHGDTRFILSQFQLFFNTNEEKFIASGRPEKSLGLDCTVKTSMKVLWC